MGIDKVMMKLRASQKLTDEEELEDKEELEYLKIGFDMNRPALVFTLLASNHNLAKKLLAKEDRYIEYFRAVKEVIDCTQEETKDSMYQKIIERNQLYINSKEEYSALQKLLYARFLLHQN